MTGGKTCDGCGVRHYDYRGTVYRVGNSEIISVTCNLCNKYNGLFVLFDDGTTKRIG